MKIQLPTISIVTCMYNSNPQMFEKMLKTVKIQNYPKKLIEHIVMDGGSKNGVLDVAKKYGCIIYSQKELAHKAEVRASLGIKKAKGKLILFLEADNFLTSKNWLHELVQPFLEDNTIICSFSAYNTYTKDMPLVAKYCALFGIPEPTLMYLKKSEKIRMDQAAYDKGEIMRENAQYWTVKFTEKNLPTIGDNGHMFLKSVIEKVNQNPEDYIHVDAFLSLIYKGYNTYAVVKNNMIHLTTSSILKVVKQRVATKHEFYNSIKHKRIYHIMNWKNPRDVSLLLLYIFFTFTFIEPLFQSIRGYIKIREKAWFLHPIMCIAMIFGYGWSEIYWLFKE